MGKNKLKKFEEMTRLECVFQCPWGELERLGGFAMRGHWREQYFHNAHPIVLELGCGKGEYAVGLAQRFPEKNFIGIDIKGARMWTGACQVRDRRLANVAFLRTSIELLDAFFAPGEVDEIWITFPDPQMKNANKRLTSTRFLELYSRVLRPQGLIHLKTDSPFLYTYTRLLTSDNHLPLQAYTDDLYGNGAASLPPDTRQLLDIRTFYEQQWLARGKTIKYLAFGLPSPPPLASLALTEPTADIPHDDYRSYSRRTPLGNS